HVTVADTEPPTITVPASFTVEATGPLGAVVTYTVTATDNEDPAPVVSCDPPSGSELPIRTTPIVCTATDAAGNTAQAVFRVTVRDTTPPSLKVPGEVDVQATSAAGAAVGFSPKATDAVDPAPVVSCDPASGSTFPLGQTKVTCTASDFSGNSSPPESFDVVVTAPAAGLVPTAPPPPPPPPPPPAPPGSVNAKPVAGRKQPKVKLPGSGGFVTLTQATALPPGTAVNVN